jgi:Tol biopolymer transport system component
MKLGPALAALLAAALAGLGGGPSDSAAGTARPAGDYWILLGSSRDGQRRAYSMRQDGSRLSPLLPASQALTPAGTSADGRMIAYTDAKQAIYASRGDGTGLRRLARRGSFDSFSPDDKLLTYGEGNIWVVGTDGRGRRRLTSIRDSEDLDGGGPTWSPDGKAVAVATQIDARHDRFGLVVQPLHGKRRVLTRSGTAENSLFAGIDYPSWSPDGRWIAFANGEDAGRRNGLWVVRPNGRGLHRLASGLVASPAWSPDGTRLAYLTVDADNDLGDLRVVDTTGGHRRRFAASTWIYAWSPDGTRLALQDADSGIVVADVDGPGSTSVNLDSVSLDSFVWSPDGRQLLLQTLDGQIWMVGSDGKGLHRLTNEGANTLAGWTPLAPSLPPAAPIPPSERVLDADTVATSSPAGFLAADGGTVAFIPQATTIDCDHVVVWTPGAASVTRFTLRTPCRVDENHVYGVAVAGSLVAWSAFSFGDTGVTVKSPALDHPVPVGLPCQCEQEDSAWPTDVPDYHLRGDGDLLVYSHRSQLVRVGVGSEKCGDLRCTILRSEGDGHACCPDSVSGGLIALREPGAVTVLDEQGKLVREFPFAPDDVGAARLDGGSLVVWRFGRLEVYDVATGAYELSRPVPGGYRLADVDGGIAVLTSADRVELLRLDDGRSFSLPGGDPTLADLEPAGLYYSYATGDGRGRVVFVPRAELAARLGGSAR